ncbi:MAG: glycosyltransferase, partial [Campylobacter hyointestinalis]
MPKISVIIPCFNAEGFLKECLESLLNQSFKDI